MNVITRATIAASILAAYCVAAHAQPAKDPIGEKAVIGYHMPYAKAQLSFAENLVSDTTAKTSGGVTVSPIADSVHDLAAMDLVVTTTTSIGKFEVRAVANGYAGKTLTAPVLVNGQKRMAEVRMARVDGCLASVCPGVARLTIMLDGGYALDLHVPAQ